MRIVITLAHVPQRSQTLRQEHALSIWGRTLERFEDTKEKVPSAPHAQVENGDDRRDALKKLGRYALYTAPAMLVLFESTKAPAASPPPP